MIFDAVDFDNHEQVVFVRDPRCGLTAIIAVHSTVLGPAVGGCRILPYAGEAEALRDVLRLSRGMTYKAAMAAIPFGGGKAVVIADPEKDKTPTLLQAVGRAIERLGGSYITGEDVGTTSADMAEIHKTTTRVMGLPEQAGGSGDPSQNTALGCLVGIEACAKHALRSRSLSGMTVAVQGLGNVGRNLCRLLADAGARLIVTDVQPARVAQCVELHGAQAIAPDAIYDADADVFAPCALGAVINDDTISRLKVRIVAGGANNQLATPAHGEHLRDRGILYAPDYVINGGGMIQLAAEITGFDKADVERRVRTIHNTLLAVFERADADGVPTSEAADRMAQQRLRSAAKAA